MKREKIKMSEEEIHNFWDGVYYESNIYNFNNEKYQQVDKINTSEYSDGPSWDYIVERKSDGKLFKFNVWDAGEHNGYIFEDLFLEEVFKETVSKTIYK